MVGGYQYRGPWFARARRFMPRQHPRPPIHPGIGPTPPGRPPIVPGLGPAAGVGYGVVDPAGRGNGFLGPPLPGPRVEPGYLGPPLPGGGGLGPPDPFEQGPGFDPGVVGTPLPGYKPHLPGLPRGPWWAQF